MGGQLVVDYRLSAGIDEPKTVSDVFKIGPNQGLFRIRPLVESRAFPEVGFYRQEGEMLEYGNNEPLLRQIAASTGARCNPHPRDVFESSGRSIAATMDLWPGLLALAVLLNLAEPVEA